MAKQRCCVRGVIGVIILSATWLTIASEITLRFPSLSIMYCKALQGRGQLTSDDALKLEQLLSWLDEDVTGAIDWGEGGRCA